MKDKTQHKHINWDLVSRFVSGEMDAEEKKNFELLVSEEPEYRDLIRSSGADMKVVDEFKKIEDEYPSDKAWKTLHERIQNNDEFSVKSRQVRPLFIKIQRVAAIFLMVLALGVSAYVIQDRLVNQQITVVAGLGEQGKEVVLPDGTILELNAGAKIEYPSKFKGESREVHFTGEGFFKVARNVDKPFFIRTPKAEVAVLGTSFNLVSSNDLTELLVETGKVKLSHIDDATKQVLLLKGDMGIVANNEIYKKAAVDENYLSWRTHQMIFSKTPLSEVVDVIEKTYNVDVKIAPALADSLHFTSTFDKEPLEIILESLGKSFNLTFEMEGRTIVFTKQLN